MLALAVFLAAILLAGPAAAQAPYLLPDESRVSLTGTVAEVESEEFVLDYGEGLITVEMDDWEWYAAPATRMMPGERVTVYGRIDDDFLEGREIAATSLYIHGRNTYYAADRTTLYLYSAPAEVEGSWINLSGTVKKVAGREFTLDTGQGEIKVDTVLMEYNPLDDVGLQQLDSGDEVMVSGRLDADLFERREIQVDTIIELREDKQKAQSGQQQQSS